MPKLCHNTSLDHRKTESELVRVDNVEQLKKEVHLLLIERAIRR